MQLFDTQLREFIEINDLQEHSLHFLAVFVLEALEIYSLVHGEASDVRDK